MPKYNTYIVTKSGERIDFTLDCGQRQRYALAVQEGRLIVRVPKHFEKSYVPNLIEDNLEWIHNAVSKSAEKIALPQTFEQGEKIRLLGETLEISYVLSENFKEPEISDGKLKVFICPTSDKAFKVGQINKFITMLASDEVFESMDRLTKLMNLYPDKVTLKSMTASWGRCSSDKKISINYKLITYPKICCDYVCIHELSHLVHMDHSAEFWRLVEKYCPQYKSIRDMMKNS